MFVKFRMAIPVKKLTFSVDVDNKAKMHEFYKNFQATFSIFVVMGV